MSNTIALVPFRSGSKRIINKNIKTFCGESLYMIVTKELAKSESIDRIVLAIDQDYYKLVTKTIVSRGLYNKVDIYIRQPANSQDDSQTEDIMLEYIKGHNLADNDKMILVQTTNPFIRSEYIDNGLVLMADYDSVLSVVKQTRFEWSSSNEGYNMPTNYDIHARVMGQHNCSNSFIENGSFYINKVKNIKADKCRLSQDIGLVVMPDYSYTEIDTEDDWYYAQYLYKKYMQEGK
jgi:CMP-N-acetylneuraminic acid synthetase